MMADTKQAAAEAVCECGDAILKVGDGTYVHIGGINAGNLWCPQWPFQAATPRTQPSRAELRIPDDLTEEYANAKAKGWQRRVELIERIARLEGAIRWANGEVGELPERKPGEGAYWWRKELMRRARLEGSR